jgi:hypothetical protein
MINIYYLEKEGVPFYVGKTKHSLAYRKAIHKYYSEIKDFNIHLLDKVSEDEWKFWEKHYIDLFKSWGFELKNKNRGGGGPSTHSEETKQKLRIPKTEEIKQKISQSKKGTKYVLIVKTRSNKGISPSQDIIEKRAKSKIGVKFTKQKPHKNLGSPKPWVSERLKNQPRSQEDKDKISKALKGRPSKTCKPVLQIDKNSGYIIKEYKSLSEAKQITGLKGIVLVCLGKCKTAGGFVWKYK